MILSPVSSVFMSVAILKVVCKLLSVCTVIKKYSGLRDPGHTLILSAVEQ